MVRICIGVVKPVLQHHRHHHHYHPPPDVPTRLYFDQLQVGGGGGGGGIGRTDGGVISGMVRICISVVTPVLQRHRHHDHYYPQQHPYHHDDVDILRPDPFSPIPQLASRFALGTLVEAKATSRLAEWVDQLGQVTTTTTTTTSVLEPQPPQQPPPQLLF
jgi:hypothetical protein